MLTEHFLASIGTTTRKPDTSSATKDAGIFLHEHQPLLAQRHAFKKSASAPKCVAVSRSHVFAAQIDKAVVHVYSRERGNQEATVPFPERITSLALALDETVLVLGTEGGRIILWEVCTGRSLTGPQSHLQSVTVLAVDPNSQFLLSGSADSNIHIWSLPSLLSFTAPANPTPLHTLSNHRGGITALAVGHSSSAANVVVSASKDNTAIVWDYRQNNLLATYLLGDTPLSLVLDPADRGFYTTYEDGSVQYIDFYTSGDSEEQAPLDSLRDPDTSYTPITPASATRWRPLNQELGAGLSITLSWDGTTILTGHSTGKIAAWSPVSSTHLKTVLNTLPGPITNLSFLPPTGFPTSTNESKYKIHAIVKPRLDLKAHVSDGEVSSPVPAAYSFNAQLVGSIARPSVSAFEPRRKSRKSAFEEALTHTSFPSDMLERSLAELKASTGSGQIPATPTATVAIEADGDYMALDMEEDADADTKASLERENKELREQVEALQRVQKATFKQLAELKEEKKKSKGAAGAGGMEDKEDEKSEKERRSARLRKVMKGLGE
ncbi:WD repeat containing protein [Neofusicoccum parvum]|uniref:WD repeat containing protein n=1 Tax=Neofusicoccum parvum TaxID=310453 RepID=A0ACB5S5C2_9PEZI|nr:WD repeat containing protein [Neofusicoccum parvum]GME65448.1 WD repeat containing protein [Neofusicoccum parvum]